MELAEDWLFPIADLYCAVIRQGMPWMTIAAPV
jgi:hypothetical protein